MQTTKWIGLIGSFLIIFINITGCSDNSYTGPMINHYTGSMLQPGDVDKYLFTSLDGRICIGTDFKSVCAAQRYGNQPIIHILPNKLVYMFYYDEKPILHAEKEMDTTDIIDKVDGGDPPNIGDPPNGGGNPPGTGDPPNGNNPPGTGNPPGNGNPPGTGDPPNGDGNPPGTGDPPNGNNPPGTGDPPNGDGNPPGTGDPPNGNNPPGTSNPPNGDGTPPNGGDPPNTDDPTDPPDANDDDDDSNESGDGGIFTKPVVAQDENLANGWYIWLYYPEDRFETGISSLEESKLEIIINGNEITDNDIVSFEQGNSEHGTYFKFFYPTAKSSFRDLTIQVTGLVSPTGTVNFIISAP